MSDLYKTLMRFCTAESGEQSRILMPYSWLITHELCNNGNQFFISVKIHDIHTKIVLWQQTIWNGTCEILWDFEW